MATTLIDQIQSFLQDRLLAFDPTIDISPGSPAQVQIVQPILTFLGTDPLETDALAFISDRFVQEFPDVYAGDPTATGDGFAKPLSLILTPLKRALNILRLGQSLEDPTVLSDEMADALVANVFVTRDPGGYSKGPSRIYFPNPMNITVETTSRFFTGGGLNFFPSTPQSITAEQMVFQREGSLFYFDVNVKAENTGADYNIDVGQLTGVDGVFGSVKVTNLKRFTDGSPSPSTPTFVETAKEGLTERSLNTRRGATARLALDVFQADTRAVQVIGAGDEEMQRDILVAASPGHAWIQGSVSLYHSIALVYASTIDGQESDVPQVGDTLFVYLSKSAYPTAQQADRFVRLTVEALICGPLAASSPYQTAYLVQWSGNFPAGATFTNPQTFLGGFSKKGLVRVSSLPDIGPVSFSVDNQDVHLFGHTDIYVRPVLRPVSKAVFSSLTDSATLYKTSDTFRSVERTTLNTNGVGAHPNLVTDSDGTFSFIAAGVQKGDLLVIESGGDQGTYTIGDFTASNLYLTADLKQSQTSLHYRVVRRVRVNPFAPRILKYPFGALTATDLSTVISSRTLTLSATDLLFYSATVGDTFRILTGPDAGDFTITGFDPTIGGRGVVVDRPLTSTGSSIPYEVFTPLEAVAKPLVRLKQMLLLDSAKQSTGISIPPADPIAVVPTSDFTSARVRASSDLASGYVLPNFTGLIPLAITSIFVNPQTLTNFNADISFNPATFGSCSWFAVVPESSSDTVNFPPITPKPGECLTLKNGPNAGSYLIRQVTKFQVVPGVTNWVYFIQVYGQFPVDVLTQLITFLNTAGGGATVTELPLVGSQVWSSVYTSILNNMGTRLDAALSGYGIASPGSTVLQTAVNALLQVQYEWGDPARGVLRTYFEEPVRVEVGTADSLNPTMFEYTTPSGDVIEFRPDPNRYDKQEIIPSWLLTEADPKTYPRDMDLAGGLSTPVFTDSSKPSMFQAGVVPGDVLSVHEEIIPSGYTTGSAYPSGQIGVQLIAGSNRLTAPTSAGAPFTAQMQGALLFIDQGPNAGGYRVTQFIDSSNVVVDGVMTETTPTIVVQGSGASWGNDGTHNKLVRPSGAFTIDLVNQWITIYGMGGKSQGAFKITALATTSSANDTVYFDQGAASSIPGYAGVNYNPARWAVSAAPATAPAQVDFGTELVALRPIRLYEDQPEDFVITTVPNISLSTSTVTIASPLLAGAHMPYRVYRPNLRIVTPTELSGLQDGPYYYFDTEIVSTSPNAAANIIKNSYLTVKPGTFESDGYKHLVDDWTLTYSTKETGVLDFPPAILPIGSADSPGNYLPLYQTPVQVVYEQSDLVSQYQTFISSAQDRITSANFLARHFLPTFVSYDAGYVGGSAPSVVAKDIFTYLDTIPIEEPIDVAMIEKKITDRGGDPNTPTRVMALIHDWDRRRWLELSQGKLGGQTTPVPYHGTPRISYFIPGADASGQNPLPDGERIVLTQS